MAYIPVINTAQVEMRATLNGEKIENVLYFQRDSSVDLAGMEELTTALASWWATECQPLLSSAYVAQEIYATDLTTATSPTFSDLENLGSAGLITASGAMPGNVALCISLRTAGRGRSARGRNYWGGLTEAQCTGNAVTSSVRTDIAVAYNLIPTYIPADWTWVVVSRVLNGVPRSSGLRQPVTEAVIVDTALDSMRRRLSGRGT